MTGCRHRRRQRRARPPRLCQAEVDRGGSFDKVACAVSYRVATIDELQDFAYREDTHMRPVRHHLGISAFGTNAWTAAREGDRLMPEHEED